MKLGLVLLAAGESKRFGVQNKLLHAVEGERLIRRVLAAFREVELEAKVVVLGHESEKVEEVLAGTGVRTVFNPNYREGMGSSLACGLRSLEGEALQGVFLCLGDLPYLEAKHVEALRERFLATKGNAIVVPCFEGKRGHPVCFPSRLFDELVALSGDKGARSVIAKESSRVQLVEMPDSGCIQDLDVI